MENKIKLTIFKQKLPIFLTLLLIAISIRILAKTSKTNDFGNNLVTQSKTAGAVEFSVTPLLQDSTYEFEVEFNTHSVELNYDLLAVAELTNEKNQTLKPIKWEGDRPEGHHREGKLIFPAFKGRPKTLNLIISGIEGQNIGFKWDM